MSSNWSLAARLDLRALHPKCANCTLLGSWVPPTTSGIIWSRLGALGCLPIYLGFTLSLHIWQRQPSRSNIAERDTGALYACLFLARFLCLRLWSRSLANSLLPAHKVLQYRRKALLVRMGSLLLHIAQYIGSLAVSLRTLLALLQQDLLQYFWPLIGLGTNCCAHTGQVIVCRHLCAHCMIYGLA